MDYTEDYLLNKKIKIFQPIDGYRASTDAVLLSAVVAKLKKSDTVLDVGSGTGAIALCLSSRFPENRITGLELQPKLVELSTMSAAANGFKNLKFLQTDIRTCKIKEQFDHIITNPPYSEADLPSPNPSKAAAHNHQDFSLEKWLNFCFKRLKPKGYLYTINRAESIDSILKIMHNKRCSVSVAPIYSKLEQNAKRVIITARLDDKSPTKILPPFVVHQANGDYTKEAEQILRLGKTII